MVAGKRARGGGLRRVATLTRASVVTPEPASRLARVFFVAFACAAVLNGSFFWLRRVGFLDPERHHLYYTRFHHTERYFVPPEELEAVRRFTAGLYRPDGWLIVGKAMKDAVTLVFLAVSAAVLWSVPVRRVHPLALGALGLTILAFVASVPRVGWVMALAGLRSMGFLFVAALAAWAASRADFRFLARVLKALLLLQAALVPIELWRGIHLFRAHFFGTPFGDRVVGTMLQPTTLGVLAVTVYVFHRVFAGEERRDPWVLGAATLVVFFTASGTALLLLATAIAWDLARKRRMGARPLLGTVLGLVLMLVALPGISGRPDILDSFWGRVDAVTLRFSDAPARILVFGYGLGAATNTANSLLRDWSREGAPGGGLFVADSTPTLLLAQVGLVGMVLVYGLIALAAVRDPEARPLYALFALASLVLNLPEAFPMNVVLGLLIARSLGLTRNSSSPGFAPPRAGVIA